MTLRGNFNNAIARKQQGGLLKIINFEQSTVKVHCNYKQYRMRQESKHFNAMRKKIEEKKQ